MANELFAMLRLTVANRRVIRVISTSECISAVLLNADMTIANARGSWRDLAGPGIIEPVSTDFEPSLWHHNADIENWRPETGARNRLDIAENSEN
jgi:hypothetical protein